MGYQLFAFYIFLLIALCIEYAMWRDIFTPFFSSGSIILFLIFVNQLFLLDFGFNSIENSNTFINIISLGLLSAFCASVSFRLIFAPACKGVNFNRVANILEFDFNKVDNQLVKKFIYILCISVNSYIFYLLLVAGVPFSNIGKEYLSEGLLAHLISYLLIAYCYLYGSKIRLKFTEGVVLFLCLLPAILYGTRGWIFLAIISGIFFRGYCCNKWPSLMRIFFGFFVFILLFVFSYYYRNYVSSNDYAFEQIMIHAIGYLFAGVQGGAELFGTNNDRVPYFNMIFSGLLNIYSFITGERNYVSNVAPNFFIINTQTFQQSNVSTVYGTVFFGLGASLGVIYFVIYFSIFYLLYIGVKKTKSINIKIFYSFMMAGLVLGFFEHYLGLLFYLELAAVLLGISLLKNLRYGIK